MSNSGGENVKWGIKVRWRQNHAAYERRATTFFMRPGTWNWLHVLSISQSWWSVAFKVGFVQAKCQDSTKGCTSDKNSHWLFGDRIYDEIRWGVWVGPGSDGGDQIVSSALQRMGYEAAPSNLKKPFEFGRATSTSLRCDRSSRIARAARPVLIKNAQQEIGR